MIFNEKDRKHVTVNFFDGVYDVVRRCYQVLNTPMFVIYDSYGDETYTVTKGYKDHVKCIFNLEEALSILEETGNLEEADRLWMEDQIRFLNKKNLASIYGKMCQEQEV